LADLRDYLEATPAIQRLGHYRFRIDGRDVDFTPAVATDGQLYPSRDWYGHVPQPAGERDTVRA
jgi:hypothetical protein